MPERDKVFPALAQHGILGGSGPNQMNCGTSVPEQLHCSGRTLAALHAQSLQAKPRP